MALAPTVICNHLYGNVDSMGVYHGRALLYHRCAVAFDALATISLLVVGILGILNVVGIPPAAAYACFGGAGLIVLVTTLYFIAMRKPHGLNLDCKQALYRAFINPSA